jgi:hypothetical protein
MCGMNFMAGCSQVVSAPASTVGASPFGNTKTTANETQTRERSIASGRANIAVISSENPDRPSARALHVLCRRTGDFNAYERKRALTTPVKSDFLFHQFLVPFQFVSV